MYVFECKNKKCKKVYETLHKHDKTGKYPEVECPHCGSLKKTQQVTACRAVIFANPRGTSKADNDTYVYGWNMENAKELRRNAEEASHMGNQPYPNYQEDIDYGNYDTPE